MDEIHCPSKEEIEALVFAELGVKATLIEASPLFLGRVSLASFGQLGWAVVFRDSKNEALICSVPMGLDSGGIA
jgi:hypothetical protein